MSKIRKMDKSTKVSNVNIKDLISKLNNNLSKHIVYIPTMNEKPNASVNYLYYFAETLKKMGKDVVVVHNEGYKKPSWLDVDTTNLETNENFKMNVTSTDFIYLPEGFVSAFFKNLKESLPCEIVVIAQVKPAILRPMAVGESWEHYGIKNVLTTSKQMKSYIESLFSGINAHVAYPHIPDYFDGDEYVKTPTVGVFSRDPEAGLEIVKKFYLRNPQYRWIKFVLMDDYSRKAFAHKLKEMMVCLWIDPPSSFGTFPLESMKSKCITIARLPETLSDWMYTVDEQGRKKLIDSMLFCNTTDDMEYRLTESINYHLSGGYKNEIFEKMANVASNYTREVFDVQVEDFTKSIIEQRKNYLKELGNNEK